MKLTITLQSQSYDIILGNHVLYDLKHYASLTGRKVMVITDSGVPQRYLEQVLVQCQEGYSYTVAQGEGSKSFATYEAICSELLRLNFTRKDCVIALGGGVVGDLSGFVAATYMRGIEFINIPTTTLSQIDSSIGGKVAINLDHMKNIVGAFYQPSLVLVDMSTLQTLPKRHFNNGLVEAIKAGLIYDSSILDLFEEESLNLEEIIYRSLVVKKEVVEQDEKEQNLRKILNFGHTIGHALESVYRMKGILHGEGVAIGMLPMIENEHLQKRISNIYSRLEIASHVAYDPDDVYEAMLKDKKANHDTITIVKVKVPGKAILEEIAFMELHRFIRG